jgi:hypothetical protein
LKGNRAEPQGRGSANHREDVRIILLIGREHDDLDLDLVVVSGGKQGAHGPVDHPHRQNLFGGRTALPLVEAPGELAGSVGLLAVVHRQRKEVDAFARGTGYHRRQDDRIA